MKSEVLMPETTRRQFTDAFKSEHGVKTTPLSGEPDVLKGPSPDANRLIQASVNSIYRQFLGVVAQSRHKLPADVDKIAICVTIHDAEVRKQNFGRVSGAYVKVYNDDTGETIAQYDLNEDYSDKTALQFGSLYRRDGEWRFQAVGAGFKLNLATFIRKLGGTV